MRPFVVAIAVAPLLLASPNALAQETTTADASMEASRAESDEQQAEADAARDAYLCRSRNLGWALVAWSAASVASGAALWATAGDDAFVRGIGIQSVAWGGIDGIIAAVGLLTSLPDDGRQETLAYWEDRRRTLETIYWVNFGLDVAYITTGALLWSLGDDDDLRGAGAGVVLQGGFLFVYDFAGAMTVRFY